MFVFLLGFQRLLMRSCGLVFLRAFVGVLCNSFIFLFKSFVMLLTYFIKQILFVLCVLCVSWSVLGFALCDILKPTLKTFSVFVCLKELFVFCVMFFGSSAFS